jgi:hypothetical protein
MYVADWSEYKHILHSTMCTKAEEEGVKKAYELARVSEYPSVSELIHLIEDSNITNMPSLTRLDVLRAYDLTPTASTRSNRSL